MVVIEQLCIKSWSIEAQNGDRWRAEQGKRYTTAIPKESEENVTVYSNFWVKVPKECFVPVETTEGEV